jgi:ABC-type transporter Mla subunit MlaD
MTAALSTARLRSVDADQARFLSRWLKVWIVLLTVVVLVVVFYLIFITNSLASINGNLGVTTNAVVGAGGHVQTLPGQIQQVNTSLTSIDSALKPITGQAGDIINALTTVNTSLQAVDGSLKDTSSSLVNTSGSLVNTSSVLQTVLATAGSINTTLNTANLPAGNCNGACGAGQVGVQNIWQRLGTGSSPSGTTINGTLASARGDTNNIAASEVPGINTQLHGICTGVVHVLTLLSPASC